jgi:hypothetical protein
VQDATGGKVVGAFHPTNAARENDENKEGEGRQALPCAGQVLSFIVAGSSSITISTTVPASVERSSRLLSGLLVTATIQQVPLRSTLAGTFAFLERLRCCWD